MFYEEKIMNGVLYSRTTPDGQWQRKTGAKADTLQALLQMQDNQRDKLLAQLGYIKETRKNNVQER